MMTAAATGMITAGAVVVMTVAGTAEAVAAVVVITVAVAAYQAVQAEAAGDSKDNFTGYWLPVAEIDKIF
jgi:hypothetical protein